MNRNVVWRTDSARSYRVKLPSVVHDSSSTKKCEVNNYNRWAWPKPTFVRISMHMLPDGPKIPNRRPTLQQIQHWPILSSWRWLVAIPTREASLSVDINLVQCLLLGLRHIRQEYQSRLSAWLALCRSTLRLQPEGYPSQKNLLQHLAAPIWTHGWQAPLVPGS